MFVKNNTVNRGYCLFQSCLNRFSLPCGRFSPKHEILHFPPRKTNAKLPLRKANAKLPPRTLRKSKPESPMSLKASPKPQCPVQDFFIKEPLQPASLPPSEPALHSPQASQTHGPPPPVASRPKDAAPSDETRPRAPLRPIRSKPLCTRAAAQPDPARPGGRFVRSVALDVAARAAAENTHVCVICPVTVIPLPCDIHPLRQSTHREIYLLGQSAHRENKNLGISATFLRLRTLPCPRKAKKEPSHGKLPAFLRLNPQLGSSQ